MSFDICDETQEEKQVNQQLEIRADIFKSKIDDKIFY